MARPPKSIIHPDLGEVLPEGCRLGGLVGFVGYDPASLVIQAATRSVPFFGLSHVALVVPHPVDDTPVLLESTTFCKRPCLITGTLVCGVQYQPIRQRVAEYFGRAYYYPLRQGLKAADVLALSNWAQSVRGTAYDYRGALDSRSTLGGWLWRLCGKENLSRLFCSELCAAGLRMVGRFDDSNCSAWSPNRLCRHQVRTGRHREALRVVV